LRIIKISGVARAGSPSGSRSFAATRARKLQQRRRRCRRRARRCNVDCSADARTRTSSSRDEKLVLSPSRSGPSGSEAGWTCRIMSCMRKWTATGSERHRLHGSSLCRASSSCQHGVRTYGETLHLNDSAASRHQRRPGRREDPSHPGAASAGATRHLRVHQPVCTRELTIHLQPGHQREARA